MPTNEPTEPESPAPASAPRRSLFGLLNDALSLLDLVVVLVVLVVIGYLIFRA